MDKRFFRLFAAVLLCGILFYGVFVFGLGYSSNLSPLEQKMHPARQHDTVWISVENDLYLVNREGTLQAYVRWQNQWQQAEFSAVGARFHVLMLGEERLTGGRISMLRQDELRWRCDPEDVFAAGRKRIVLQRYDLQNCLDSLPFSLSIK